MLKKIIHFFVWWLAFFGLYSSSSICPFCGQPGCPVGVGSAGFIGGFFALIIQYGQTLISFLKTKFIRK